MARHHFCVMASSGLRRCLISCGQLHTRAREETTLPRATSDQPKLLEVGQMPAEGTRSHPRGRSQLAVGIPGAPLGAQRLIEHSPRAHDLPSDLPGLNRPHKFPGDDVVASGSAGDAHISDASAAAGTRATQRPDPLELGQVTTDLLPHPGARAP